MAKSSTKGFNSIFSKEKSKKGSKKSQESKSFTDFDMYELSEIESTNLEEEIKTSFVDTEGMYEMSFDKDKEVSFSDYDILSDSIKVDYLDSQKEAVEEVAKEAVEDAIEATEAEEAAIEATEAEEAEEAIEEAVDAFSLNKEYYDSSVGNDSVSQNLEKQKVAEKSKKKKSTGKSLHARKNIFTKITKLATKISNNPKESSIDKLDLEESKAVDEVDSKTERKGISITSADAVKAFSSIDEPTNRSKRGSAELGETFELQEIKKEESLDSATAHEEEAVHEEEEKSSFGGEVVDKKEEEEIKKEESLDSATAHEEEAVHEEEAEKPKKKNLGKDIARGLRKTFFGSSKSAVKENSSVQKAPLVMTTKYVQSVFSNHDNILKEGYLKKTGSKKFSPMKLMRKFIKRQNKVRIVEKPSSGSFFYVEKNSSSEDVPAVPNVSPTAFDAARALSVELGYTKNSKASDAVGKFDFSKLSKEEQVKFLDFLLNEISSTTLDTLKETSVTEFDTNDSQKLDSEETSVTEFDTNDSQKLDSEETSVTEFDTNDSQKSSSEEVKISEKSKVKKDSFVVRFFKKLLGEQGYVKNERHLSYVNKRPLSSDFEELTLMEASNEFDLSRTEHTEVSYDDNSPPIIDISESSEVLIKKAGVKPSVLSNENLEEAERLQYHNNGFEAIDLKDDVVVNNSNSTPEEHESQEDNIDYNLSGNDTLEKEDKSVSATKENIPSQHLDSLSISRVESHIERESTRGI